MDKNNTTSAPVAPAPATSNTPTPTSGSFPSVESLFSDAFQTFKKSFVKVLLFVLLIFGISLALIFVDFILVLLFGVSLLTFKVSNILPFLLGGPLLIILIVSIIFGIAISLISQSALILIVNDPENESVGAVFKKSFKYALPLFIAGLLVALLTIPTYFLFVIPGIVIALLFSFFSYELVIGNKGIIGSIKRSIYVIKTNFWSIFGRVAIFWILSWVIRLSFRSLFKIFGYLNSSFDYSFSRID